MTLLQKFIKEKGANYVPPERRGTPKGDPIGFSSEKYEATLFMLTDMKQKDMADKLGISHGLLRKWNTEEPFKEEVKRHLSEFVTTYMKYLSDKALKGDKLRDSANYSPILREMLAQAITKRAMEQGFTAFFGIALDALRLLGGEGDERIRQYQIELMRHSERQVLGEIKRILKKTSPSPEEKRRAISLLNFVEKTQEKER